MPRDPQSELLRAMSGGVRVITEPLGGSALAREAIAGRLSRWYVAPPHEPPAWAERCRVTRRAHDDGWLDAVRPALGDSFSVTAAGERLARTAAAPDGVVVTTGQQPGLFGGPIYTWSKALSALALADALEAGTGCAVAPIFWAATDDADFAEASVTVVSLAGGPRALRLERAHAETMPMAHTPLRDDARDAFEWLARASGSASYGEILHTAREAYTPGETVGGAYLRLLRAVLEPLGIAVLDASHHATRGAGDAILRQALRAAGAIDDALLRRAAELEASGHAPQVPHVRGLSLVFAEGRGGRWRIPLDEAARRSSDASHGTLAPNVLLRPVVEREILPTVSYVAGPGEIAYFAQVSAVAESLSRPAPLAVPRWSCTIVEPHIARVLARLELDISELADPHGAETRLARAALPEAVAAALADLREAVRTRSAALRVAQEETGQVLLSPETLVGAERALAHRVDRLERRAVAAQKRASESLMRDVATVRGALYPFGVRQERALNLLPTLARHGQAVLESMRAAAAVHAESIAGATTTRGPGGGSEERRGVAAG